MKTLTLNDQKWKKICKYFPAPSLKGRPRKWPLRKIIEGILWILWTGAPWRALPDIFPPYSTVYRYFKSLSPTLEEIINSFIDDIPEKEIHDTFIDGSLVPSAQGSELVGFSKKGKAIKIIALCKSDSLPLTINIVNGATHESKEVSSTVLPLVGKIANIIGDKAYDSDNLDNEMMNNYRINVIAPHKDNRKKPKTQDGRTLRKYKKRFCVERLFAWLKFCRRLRVKYDQTIEGFRIFVLYAMVMLWVKHL